ncbi:hypothetical protein Bca52824_033295 [Brassica carinata]|uniref:Uncharacterized protein n=1 Tax=Brassica carinata TaxID=52824 RepID=A0A8X7SII7_BRACI|nr:hypothetical protein Bca52824_033295 [Brassica carinata]
MVLAEPHRFRTVQSYNTSEGKWVQLPDPGENFEKRGGAGSMLCKGRFGWYMGFRVHLSLVSSSRIKGPFRSGILTDDGFALDTETLVWERIKGGMNRVHVVGRLPRLPQPMGRKAS